MTIRDIHREGPTEDIEEHCMPEPEEREPHWCEHISWEPSCDGDWFWWFRMEDDALKSIFPDQDCSDHVHVPESWKCCPICIALRPKTLERNSP